jgi:Zn-dependent M28 family amino/carboxypeptidase
MQGRRTGEIGNYKTTSYIASEFKRLGLKPAGDNGTYFQVLPWGNSQFDSTKARLIAAGSPLAPKADWIPIPAAATSRIVGDANVRDVPAVFAGRWGDTSTALDVNALRGKVAVFTAPQRDTGARGGRGGTFTSTPDPRAANAGAALVLVTSLDSMPRNAVAAAFNPRAGMQPEGGPGVPAAAISKAAAARLFGRPVDELSIGASGQPVSASWTNEFTPTKYPARNVIAILPGSDPARAGEYVLVGAHNDHVGMLPNPVDHDSLRAFNRVMRPQGANDRLTRPPTAEQKRRIDSLIAYARSIRPPRRDSINNGADDDGSGTVVMLEIAEKFASEHPARSIVFISHQGEEQGLLGSKWFVDHPTIPLDSIVAAHNMDMVGKGRVTDVKFGGPNSVQTLGSRRLSREFGDIVDSVNAVSAEPMAIDRSWDVPANPLNRFCRSDQVNYVHHNVPVTYFSLGYAVDYHQPTDEPRYVDYEHAARLGRFIHDVMLAIANRRDKPAIAGPDPSYPACR